MNALDIIFQLSFSVILSAVITKLFIPFLKKYFSYVPNKRSSHIKSKPTAGGISFVSVGTIFLVINGNISPLFCLPLAFVGFWDDFIKLSRLSRFLVQFFTVIFLFYNSLFFNYLLEEIDFYRVIFISFIIIFFLGVINFINFMDGIDGLVAGSMIVIFFTGAILISNSYYPLLGALLGFTIFNWHPSRVFMGDGGSTFLGGVFIGLILLSDNWLVSLKIVLVAMPLLADALICLVRRFLYKESIFEAHRSHLYQRLNQAGLSHGYVSTIYIVFTSFLALSVIFFNLKITFLFIFIEFLIAFFLDQKVSVPFLSSISSKKSL